MQDFREKKLKSDVFCRFCKVNFIKWRFITAKVERSKVLLCRLAKWIANLAKYALDERCQTPKSHLLHLVGCGVGNYILALFGRLLARCVCYLEPPVRLTN